MRLWGCGEILREEPSRLKMELFLYVLRLDLKCSIVDLKVPCSDFGRRSGGVHSFSANVGSSRPSSPLCSTNLIVAIPVLQQAHGCGSKHVETELCNSHVHKVGGFSPRNDTEHLSLQINLFPHPPMFYHVLPIFSPISWLTYIPSRSRTPDSAAGYIRPDNLAGAVQEAAGGLEVGARVRIVGLQKQQHLNSAMGVLVKFHGDRWQVGMAMEKRRMSLDLKTLVLMGCYLMLH